MFELSKSYFSYFTQWSSSHLLDELELEIKIGM